MPEDCISSKQTHWTVFMYGVGSPVFMYRVGNHQTEKWFHNILSWGKHTHFGVKFSTKVMKLNFLGIASLKLMTSYS